MTDTQTIPHDAAPRARAYPTLLVAACLLLWGWTCGLWDLWGADESRYVQVATELLHRTNWLQLTLHGMPYDQKPPLPFWLIALMLRLSDGAVNNYLVRLPSVAFAILGVLTCFAIGRRLWSAYAGLVAALALMTCAQFMADAPSAELNIMFTGWTTLAIAVWMLRPALDAPLSWPRTLCFWGAIAGAFFTKGPLALIIVLAAPVGESIARRTFAPLRSIRPITGLFAILAAIAGWLLLQASINGWDFVVRQVVGQSVDRFLEGDHAAPFWFYLLRIFTAIFVPWAWLMIPAGVVLWRRRRQLPDGMGAVLGWVLIPLLVLTLAEGKRESYPLPILPGMALVVGWYLDTLRVQRRTFPRTLRAFAALTLLGACGLLAGWIALFAAPDLLVARGLSPIPLAWVMLPLLALAMAALALLTLRHAHSPEAPGPALAALIFLVGILVFSVIYPALNGERSHRELALRIQALARERGEYQVGAVDRAARPEYHVYGDYIVRTLDDDELGTDSAALPSIVITRANEWDDLHKEAPLNAYSALWREQAGRNPLVIATRPLPH